MRVGRSLSWLVALVGLWELVSPFVLGFSGHTTPLYNSIIFGILLIILGVWAANSRDARTDRTLDIVNAIIGIWLIIAPFVLGFAATVMAAEWSSIIVGIVTLVLGVIAAYEFRTPTTV
jgi:hypothetical protein